MRPVDEADSAGRIVDEVPRVHISADKAWNGDSHRHDPDDRDHSQRSTGAQPTTQGMHNHHISTVHSFNFLLAERIHPFTIRLFSQNRLIFSSRRLLSGVFFGTPWIYYKIISMTLQIFKIFFYCQTQHVIRKKVNIFFLTPTKICQSGCIALYNINDLKQLFDMLYA